MQALSPASAGFLLGLLLDPEEGCDMFHGYLGFFRITFHIVTAVRTSYPKSVKKTTQVNTCADATGTNKRTQLIK
jgi:hypothetical protein